MPGKSLKVTGMAELKYTFDELLDELADTPGAKLHIIITKWEDHGKPDQDRAALDIFVGYDSPKT